MKIGGYRLVNLSQTIDPHTSTRLCEVDRFFQDATQDYHSRVRVESHLGTHIESPYHFKDAWQDLPDLSLTAYIGRAVLLKLECDPRAPITKTMLDAANKGHVRPGDIIILDSPYHSVPFAGDPNDQRPYLTKESGEWFVEKKAKCIGFGSGVAIEYSVRDACDIHDTVMKEGITFLEVMQNIDRLRSNVFFMSCTPMPIKTLDSCCVWAYAIEGLPGFTE